MSERPRIGHGPRRVAGQSSTEVVVILLFVVLLLLAGPDSPVEQLVRAAHTYYERFTFAMGMP